MRESETERHTRLWQIETELREGGISCIAGVDEAGRGPLAGPVVVAAVILPHGVQLPGLNDSKKVPEHTREKLYELITACALCFSIQVISPAVIDELNILRATHYGMRTALLGLAIVPELALIDGLPLPDSPLPQQNLIKGDSRSASIAAASILAKVTRDRLLLELDALYPEYGFARHKGYPTADHLAALRTHGPCPEHRRSYAPVRAVCEGNLLTNIT